MRIAFGLVVLACGMLAGCGGDHSLTCPRVLFLDGAGWYTADSSVRKGLKEAGYEGTVERFGWSSIALGALVDHLTAGPDHPAVESLARRITDLRRANPSERIDVMALSAGTAIAVYALEQLPPDVRVDHVVLLSPSISCRTDLRDALLHVKARLYYTQSPYDSLLAMGSSAGGEGGRPAGRVGFFPPENLDPGSMHLYEKVTPLLWLPEYAAYGWNGGHVSSTSPEFIRVVIAPRLKDEERHPMDKNLINPRTRT